MKLKQTLPTLIAALSLTGAVLADHIASHTKTLVLRDKEGAAILGYDPVAYFTDSKATKGNPKFKSNCEGANYFFASAEHKTLFDANPAKYAPAYGGYCGYAPRNNRLFPVSPGGVLISAGKQNLPHNQKTVDPLNNKLNENTTPH